MGGGSSKKQTVGYKYHLGIHMILCHGEIDALTKITVDGRDAWAGTHMGGPITIDKPNLFGGEDREGGVKGTLDVEMGSNVQGQNSYLRQQLGAQIPAYRGVVGIVLRQMYIGMNPYLKNWAFWGLRTNKLTSGQAQWRPDRCAIGWNMNPAHIIRECFTDAEWGLGYPTSEIDDESFGQAADILYSESFGLSLLWDKAMEIKQFIATVLQHIDGSIYMHRTTGKFKLALARGGYDVSSLPVLGENEIKRITDFKRTSLGELTNSVTVIYTNSETGENNSVTVQDIALAARQKTTIGAKLEFPGITDGNLASRVASRELKAMSTPLASAVIYANRTASKLNGGELFVLNWPRLGITSVVMRITDIEFGNLDSGDVKITAVEDVFALGSAIYAAPPPSGWVDPVNEPAPCPFHIFQEASYWEIVRTMGEDSARSLLPTSAYTVGSAVRPSSDAISAKMHNNNNAGQWQQVATMAFCPTAVLANDIGYATTTLELNNSIDLDIVQVGTYACVGNEVVLVTSVGENSVVVARGCLDTTPQLINAGTRIFFADSYFVSDGVEYAIGATPSYKVTPITGKGELAVANAPTQPMTPMVGRQYKPYAPGFLLINDNYYPSTIRGDTAISLTWVHRDRLTQTVSIIPSSSNTSIGPETGVTYEVDVKLPNGSIAYTASGITTAFATIPAASLTSVHGEITISVTAVRDGVKSHQSLSCKLIRAGYGASYGNAYGGI